MRTKSCLLLLAFCLAACGGSSEKGEEKVTSNAANLTNKERQYFTNGKRLYESLCMNCHMDQGQGLGKLIPPLKGSDYLMKNVPAAARIVKYGLDGPIAVNGQEYNQPMPANPRLTNIEIAEILTFISNSWGNTHGGVTIDEVANNLKERVD